MKKVPGNKVTLKRSLSLPLLIFYGAGTILGLGIYILVGKIAGEAGMFAPLSFVVAAVLAIFTGMSYGELSARIPKSGGIVNYVEAAFNKRFLSMAIGWLIVLSAIVSTATVLNGYVGYVHVFADIPAWIVICAAIFILGSIAAWGITESAATITIITIIEFLGIFLVIFLARDNLLDFPQRFHEFVPSFSFADWKGIFMGTFLAFFTFIGFEDMVNVAEEAKNPKRDMPIAIIVSLVILTVLYVLVSVIAALGLTPAELDQSAAPLADILAKENESYSMIISGIGLIAIINGSLVQIVMCARVLLGMAREKMAPKIFGVLNSKTRTPIWSTFFAAIFILLLALSFELESLAKATNYILIVAFLLVNASLLAIKKRKPKEKGVYAYPTFVPVLGFVMSLAILVFQIYVSLENVV